MRRTRELSAASPARHPATTTLREQLRAFGRHASPWILAFAVLALGVTRLVLGRWRVWDLVVGIGVLTGAPFAEWLIHVFVLHAKPKQAFGLRFDFYSARKHRAHHRDPRDARLIFIPAPILVGLLAVWGVLSFVIAHDKRLAGTAMMVGIAFIFGYEWTHFLIHSTYVPRHRLYRRIWRNHRLHHFKNEKYWFGVTSQIADAVLGTNPARDAVESSPTAMTLGLEEAV
jgi:hypothetical protein